ncbi:MAG: O-antigen ligase family protein [Acidobacteria bacterium]|nr:O-antigen ligase family protein [Acidobacteriota bacterium]
MRWFAPATLLLVGWGALAFGAEYPWAYAPLLVFGATIGGLGLAARAPGAGRFRAVGLALGLVGAAAALQAAPLPQAVLSAVSPARFDRDWHALYAAEMPAEVGRPAPAISIRPPRTVLGLAFLTGLSLFFLGAARALTAVRPSGVARGLIVLGVLVALDGIVQAAGGGRLVNGFWYPRKAWEPAAPFINPNHFAGWMVMAVSVAAGHLGALVTRALRDAPPDWRRRAIRLGSREGSEILLVGFAVLVMALSVFVTGSVSGMVCLAAALAGCAGWATRRLAGWRRLAVPAAAAAALGAAAAWAGLGAVGTEVAATLASALDAGGRPGLWRDTLRIAGDFPLTGTGLNTYGVAMLAYQTEGLEMRAVEAHNDYLQLAAEGGLLLGVPIVLAAGVFAREVRRRFREGTDDMRTRWLRVGAVTGLGAAALQALVDFSLQMPGNAVLFALLMAIAVHRPGPRRSRVQSVRTHSGGGAPPPRSQS